MKKLIDFLNKLEERNIYYKLNKINDEFIMVEIVIPGERWEVELSPDLIRIEKFISNGEIFGESELDILFEKFSH